MTKEVPRILQLRIELCDTNPMVWRRILIPEGFSLRSLQYAICDVMGWKYMHLYCFKTNDRDYGDPEFDSDFGWLDDSKYKVGKTLEAHPEIEFVYDFGDDWRHKIIFEDYVLPDFEESYPVCIAGENHGPPEDCGGPPGFEEFKKVISDKNHPEHQDMSSWYRAQSMFGRPTFEVGFFDVEFTDMRIGRKQRLRGFRSKVTKEKRPQKAIVSEMSAWEAFENQNYSLAESLWVELIENESDPNRKDDLLSGYGYTLCNLGKYEIAHLIYESLYRKTSDHIYLHQLAMVERERGRFSKALNYILEEKEMILEGKTSLPLELALGANSYESGKLRQLLGALDEAFNAANECLYFAMNADDKIMLACAFRLLGDIETPRDRSTAKIFYEMAIAAFDDAGDNNGIMEIEKKLSAEP